MAFLYEIINPSDPCSFTAPNATIAALVTVALGSGQYSATSEDEGAVEIPFFMFGGLDEWWAQHGDGAPLEGAVERHAEALIPALRSVCVGDKRQRRLFDKALVAIDDPAKRATFIEEWNDERRTSMNDIMGRAHRLAERLEASKAASSASLS